MKSYKKKIFIKYTRVTILEINYHNMLLLLTFNVGTSIKFKGKSEKSLENI